jgi:hypothetical protein
MALVDHAQRLLKVQRGEGQASDATLLYQRMLKALRRRGIEKPAWLTPCEFARVLQEPELARLLVEDFTGAYNELRFGGNAEAAGRIFVFQSQSRARPLRWPRRSARQTAKDAASKNFFVVRQPLAVALVEFARATTGSASSSATRLRFAAR